MAKAQIKASAKIVVLKKGNSKKVEKAGNATKPGKTVFRTDAKQTAALVKVGRLGAANAIRASKALGLPITYMQKGIMYKELPNGTRQIIPTAIAKKIATKKTAISLRKGMVLHAKK